MASGSDCFRWTLGIGLIVAVTACQETAGAGGRDGGAVDTAVLVDARAADDAAVADVHAGMLASAPRVVRGCAAENEAPLRTGNGIDEVECTRVGALPPTGASEWPDTTDVEGPVAHVAQGASGGGDGSRERPFATIAAALGSGARTIALRRGFHRVAGALAVDRAATLVGAGAGATVLASTRGHAIVEGATGVAVSLRGLSLAYDDGAADERDVAVDVAGDASMEDLEVTRASIGVRARGGALRARRVTVASSARYDVLVAGDARAELDLLWLRGGPGQGVRAEGGRVMLRRSLVVDHARHGVVLTGTPSAVGFDDCANPASRGARDCFDQVVAARNGVAGLYAEGPRAVDARRMSLRDTRLASVGVGEAGDGLVANAGATLRLDHDLVDVAMRGFGSEVSGNARAGVLAQGERTRITVRGGWILRNAVGAVFLAGGARAEVIGESLMLQNRFAGVVVVPGAEAAIVQCNGIAETAMGATPGATSVMLADGIHLNGALGTVDVHENIVEGNAGFGLLVNDARALVARNRGAENRYGVGRYNGAVIDGDGTGIAGREATPMVAPGLAGAL